VGRVEREKGAIDLLDAVESLPNAHVVLVGEGGAKAACEERARASNGRIRLVGARPLSEVPQWMAASDCVVLPSWNEGTPNVVLEALNCGRRVVATAVGGVPDVLDDGLLGELVPPREPGALAAALRRVLAEPYDPSAVAQRGGRGDWNQSAAALLKILEEAVGDRP
jgi:glycosyltransferase involved in cell wall biosynthesis